MSLKTSSYFLLILASIPCPAKHQVWVLMPFVGFRRSTSTTYCIGMVQSLSVTKADFESRAVTISFCVWWTIGIWLYIMPARCFYHIWDSVVLADDCLVMLGMASSSWHNFVFTNGRCIVLLPERLSRMSIHPFYLWEQHLVWKGHHAVVLVECISHWV